MYSDYCKGEKRIFKVLAPADEVCDLEMLILNLGFEYESNAKNGLIALRITVSEPLDIEFVSRLINAYDLALVPAKLVNDFYMALIY